jgi:hypothetical protein
MKTGKLQFGLLRTSRVTVPQPSPGHSRSIETLARHARKVSLFPIVRMATCMASSYCCSWLKLYSGSYSLRLHPPLPRSDLLLIL